MNNQPSTARTALKWGLITGIALIVYSTILYTFSQTTNSALSLIIYGILIIGLVMGMREYRLANDGYMSYGEGMGLGHSYRPLQDFCLPYSLFFTPS